MDRIAEITARHAAATPGPYMWDIRTGHHFCLLVTTHSGQYYVMGFERWGMQDACPTFQVYDEYSGPVNKRGSQGMVRADKMAKSYPGKEHHKGFDDYINHPDAIALAKSWEDVDFLLSETARLTSELARVTAERDAVTRDLCNCCRTYADMDGCQTDCVHCDRWRGEQRGGK